MGEAISASVTIAEQIGVTNEMIRRHRCGARIRLAWLGQRNYRNEGKSELVIFPKRADALQVWLVAWRSPAASRRRVRLSERTLAGLATARAQGRVGGRPRVSCDEQRLLSLRTSGKSLATIAGELKLSKSTVARLLAEAQ
jgi:DNA-binding NarL/FixJ family response regulator